MQLFALHRTPRHCPPCFATPTLLAERNPRFCTNSSQHHVPIGSFPFQQQEKTEAWQPVYIRRRLGRSHTGVFMDAHAWPCHRQRVESRTRWKRTGTLSTLPMPLPRADQYLPRSRRNEAMASTPARRVRARRRAGVYPTSPTLSTVALLPLGQSLS